jgi:hypothetical protein
MMEEFEMRCDRSDYLLRKHFFIFLLFVACCMLISISIAQAEAPEGGERPDLVEVIDGSSTPEAVPRSMKMQEFLNSYQGQLDEQLSAYDRAVLVGSIRNVSRLEGIKYALRPVYVQNTICPEFANSDDVVTMLRGMETFEYTHQPLIEQELEAFFMNLSEPGKFLVLNFIDENITPSIQYRKVDRVRHAQEYRSVARSHYLSEFRDMCEQPQIRGEFVIEREIHAPQEAAIAREYPTEIEIVVTREKVR